MTKSVKNHPCNRCLLSFSSHRFPGGYCTCLKVQKSAQLPQISQQSEELISCLYTPVVSKLSNITQSIKETPSLMTQPRFHFSSIPGMYQLHNVCCSLHVHCILLVHCCVIAGPPQQESIVSFMDLTFQVSRYYHCTAPTKGYPIHIRTLEEAQFIKSGLLLWQHSHRFCL